MNGGGSLAFGAFHNRSKLNNILVSVRNATVYEPSNMPEESNQIPFNSNSRSGLQNGFIIQSFEVEFDSSEFEPILIDELNKKSHNNVVWTVNTKTNDLKRINSMHESDFRS